jgi:Ca2+-binding RTX toxin-like protein
VRSGSHVGPCTQAGEGEANNVTVALSSDLTTWTVTDTGAPQLTVGSGCTPINAQQASCAAPAGGDSRDHRVDITLGDMDDRASGENACSARYDGYPAFAECAVTIRGGDGNDTLVGHFDGDVPRAFGETRETTSCARTGAHAREGNDVVYGDTAACAADAGGAGGADRLYGGPGEDGLLGCGGNDVLAGLDGSDSLSGSGGADRLYGGDGSDAGYRGGLSGGLGNDVLYSRDGYRDLVRGGPGYDRAQIDRSLDRRYAIERLF